MFKMKIPKSNIEMVERSTLGTPNTLLHHRSLSWLGTSTSIQSGGVKLVLWIKPLS